MFSLKQLQGTLYSYKVRCSLYFFGQKRYKLLCSHLDLATGIFVFEASERIELNFLTLFFFFFNRKVTYICCQIINCNIMVKLTQYCSQTQVISEPAMLFPHDTKQTKNIFQLRFSCSADVCCCTNRLQSSFFHQVQRLLN